MVRPDLPIDLDDSLTYQQAIMCLVREAEDVAEDGTQPRLAACLKAFWRAYMAQETHAQET